MKALSNIYETIISDSNLFKAAKMTLSRGRRYYGSGARYSLQLEREVFRMQQQLQRGTYRPGRYRLFQISDPKPRKIAAAPFRDRVLHHAIHDVIEPYFDRMFIHDSYACRREKGVFKALDRAQRFCRACTNYTQLDVRQYFGSINHTILKGILSRYIGDMRLLQLLFQIVDSSQYLAGKGIHGAEVGTITKVEKVKPRKQLNLFDQNKIGVEGVCYSGLPLGNLTSQLFANLYLNELDQFVKHKLKVRYYLRYMDDFVLFEKDKSRLRELEEAIRDFCKDHLALDLHKGGVRPTSRGLSFLGFRLYLTHRRLKKRSIGRFIRRSREQQVIYSGLKERYERRAYLRQVRQSVHSFNGFASHGNTYGLRRQLYDDFKLIRTKDFLPPEKARPNETTQYC